MYPVYFYESHKFVFDIYYLCNNENKSKILIGKSKINMSNVIMNLNKYIEIDIINNNDKSIKGILRLLCKQL